MSNYDVLEKKYQIWKQNRLKTIAELRDMADYIDKVTKDVGIAKVFLTLNNFVPYRQIDRQSNLLCSCRSQKTRIQVKGLDGFLVVGCWVQWRPRSRSPVPYWRHSHLLHSRGRRSHSRHWSRTWRGQRHYWRRCFSVQTYHQVSANVQV